MVEPQKQDISREDNTTSPSESDCALDGLEEAMAREGESCTEVKRRKGYPQRAPAQSLGQPGRLAIPAESSTTCLSTALHISQAAGVGREINDRVAR